MKEPTADVNGHLIDYEASEVDEFGQWTCRRCGEVRDYGAAFRGFPCTVPPESSAATGEAIAE